ncbi:MAG TPA: GspH/FimT family pseudopilin, partial [Gemmatimonadales bacterium]|nr:GspH/FimT family pseudopilin [Gemmatimonadales bacterium]
AVGERRVVLLALTADSLRIRAVETPADTVIRWHSGGPASLGVTVTGLPHTLTFTPAGVTLGLANATYRLSRGAAGRQVVVSRYGRVRIP